MKLVKILSDSVQIRTNLSEFKDIRINDLLMVSDRTASLVTMVTGLVDTDAEERIGEQDFLGEITGIKSIDCSIIGSIKDGRFVKAIDTYPTTCVEISRITSMESVSYTHLDVYKRQAVGCFNLNSTSSFGYPVP